MQYINIKTILLVVFLYFYNISPINFFIFKSSAWPIIDKIISLLFIDIIFRSSLGIKTSNSLIKFLNFEFYDIQSKIALISPKLGFNVE